MTTESSGERNKQRVLNLNPTNAQEGFHYEGEPAKWFEGKTYQEMIRMVQVCDNCVARWYEER